ncbi:MAG: hypothetical protein V3T43_06220 [Nitrosomonadaceae bacterium]
MKLKYRKILGKISQAVYPGYGCCGRCGLPWAVTDGHTTEYTKVNGCFPLCEECWSELKPKTRLPYYRELHDKWVNYGEKAADWNKIKRAVLNGK